MDNSVMTTSSFNPEETSPRVVFVLPFAGISSGKSYVWKQIQKLAGQANSNELLDGQLQFASVSSDGIRKEEMDRLMAQKKVNATKAFQMSGKSANKLYSQRQIELIRATKDLQGGQVRVIYFDKNHHPKNGIKSVVDTIHRNMPSNIPYTTVYLIPKIEQQAIEGYPFSYQFMAQAMANGSLRRDHETISSDNLPNLFGIILLFLSFSSEVQFNDKFLANQGLNAFLELPMTNEKLEVDQEFPELLMRANEVAKSCKGNFINPDSPELLELIEHVQKFVKQYSVHTPDSDLQLSIQEELWNISQDWSFWNIQ